MIDRTHRLHRQPHRTFCTSVAGWCAILAAILLAQPAIAATKTEEPPTPPAKTAEETAPAPEFWVRPVKVEIADDSPLRNDDAVNKPPKIYVLCKKGDATVGKCPVHKGWDVDFPKDDDHEVLMGDGATDEYTVEVWDSQWRKDKLLFSIGPLSGSEWRKKLSDAATKGFVEDKAIAFDGDAQGTKITLAYAGTRIWYRLVNVTIPPASPHQKDNKLNSPPRLQVYLKNNGEYYGSKSTRHVGWSTDFPKVTENCWAVREGTTRRYTVEVTDNQKSGWQQIFSVSGLNAKQFRAVIQEDVGPLVDKDRASTVIFERIEKPF